jgi:DNA repair protein SbcD/Mre11
MKILHTSDWHVGRTLHRRPRLDEVEAALREVTQVAEEEAVDLVLVCGDVFDHAAPSADAERVLYDALLALRATGARVLVVPGNHDNTRRFAAVEELLRAAGIDVVPQIRRPHQGGVLEIPSRNGDVAAQVAVLPWVPERALFGAAEMMGLEEAPHQAYAERVAELVRALCAELDPSKATVLAGHLFVSGARLGGGERELTIGQIYAINPAALPTGVQYIALGHVHRPQDVPGAATPARYAGSLLQLDFGEAEQDKSVTIVELEPGRPARTRERPLSAGLRLRDVRGTLAELRAIESDPASEWLRVTLVCDGPAPGLADEVREALPGALEVRLEYEREDPERHAAELRRLKPRELFERYYANRHGKEPDEAVVKLFDELLEEVSGEAA